MQDTWFQRYLLPGFVFQSTMIAGAYGSGRELAVFFLPHGPVGGLLGMLVTAVVFSLVLAVSYELARRFRLFDYRSFTKQLLGVAWPAYEVLYVLLMLLVISVIGAAAGEILRDSFGLPPLAGTLAVMGLIALLVFYGTSAIEPVFAVWSFVLYGCYLLFFVWHVAQHGGAMAANLGTLDVRPGWVRSGLAYAGYNIATVPALLFCLRHVHRPREAVTAGLLGGPIAMIPAMLFFGAMAGQYDALVAAGDEVLPITLLFDRLQGATLLAYAFPIVLFGTFVETGTALIHGVNERIDQVYVDRGEHMPRWLRPALALAILFTAIVLADAVGLTGLVTRGYGLITYGFLAVYVVPVLTFGVWTIRRAARQERGATQT